MVVDPSSFTVAAGGVASLNVTCFDEYGNELSGVGLSWAPSVGTVSSTGLGSHAIYHAGTSAGSGTIIVGAGSMTSTVNVTIVHGTLDRLVVSPVSISLISGESAQLEVKGYDAYGNEVDGLVFEWSFIASSTGGASGTVSPGVEDSTATFVADHAGTGLITVISSGESANVQCPSMPRRARSRPTGLRGRGVAAPGRHRASGHVLPRLEEEDGPGQ